MIYIDPPYNTGNDFLYKDDYSQSRESYKEDSGLVDESKLRLFKNQDTSVLRSSELLKKHVYDFLQTDSNVEKEFLQALENNVEVVVYAKLPKSFYITTPIANYTPDWAIVFDKERVRHIYFVAETKGSDSDKELREIEKLKIHCAKKHFEAISPGEVRFEVVKDFQKLLEIVQPKG